MKEFPLLIDFLVKGERNSKNINNNLWSVIFLGRKRIEYAKLQKRTALPRVTLRATS